MKKKKVTIKALKKDVTQYGTSINKNMRDLIENINSLITALDLQRKSKPKCCVILPLNKLSELPESPDIWFAKLIDLPIDPVINLVIKFPFGVHHIIDIQYNIYCQCYELTLNQSYTCQRDFDELKRCLPQDGWYIYKKKDSKLVTTKNAKLIYSNPMGTSE